jgi:hypothetical protein
MEHVFNTFLGALLFITMLIVNLVGHEKIAFSIVGIAVFIDLVLGIVSSLKQKKFILSALVSDTFYKVIIYGSMLLVIGLIEKLLHDGSFALYVACSVAAACELISISAHALIIAPKMPFPKIFRLQLKGEIESKTGVNTDNIFNFNDKEDGKNPI